HRPQTPHGHRAVDPDAANATDHNSTAIYRIASDHDGRHSNAHGAAPVKVNDDTGTASQFFSWIGVDQKSGDVAVSWYDTRNDTDATPNDEVQYFAAISHDGGAHWSKNVQVSDGTSQGGKIGGGDLGDYTGLAFVDGTA